MIVVFVIFVYSAEIDVYRELDYTVYKMTRAFIQSFEL